MADRVAILTPRIEELERLIVMAKMFMPPGPISINVAEARVLIDGLKQLRDAPLKESP